MINSQRKSTMLSLGVEKEQLNLRLKREIRRHNWLIEKLRNPENKQNKRLQKELLEKSYDSVMNRTRHKKITPRRRMDLGSVKPFNNNEDTSEWPRIMVADDVKIKKIKKKLSIRLNRVDESNYSIVEPKQLGNNNVGDTGYDPNQNKEGKSVDINTNTIQKRHNLPISPPPEMGKYRSSLLSPAKFVPKLLPKLEKDENTVVISRNSEDYKILEYIKSKNYNLQKLTELIENVEDEVIFVENKASQSEIVTEPNVIKQALALSNENKKQFLKTTPNLEKINQGSLQIAEPNPTSHPPYGNYAEKEEIEYKVNKDLLETLHADNTVNIPRNMTLNHLVRNLQPFAPSSEQQVTSADTITPAAISPVAIQSYPARPRRPRPPNNPALPVVWQPHTPRIFARNFRNPNPQNYNMYNSHYHLQHNIMHQQQAQLDNRRSKQLQMMQRPDQMMQQEQMEETSHEHLQNDIMHRQQHVQFEQQMLQQNMHHGTQMFRSPPPAYNAPNMQMSAHNPMSPQYGMTPELLWQTQNGPHHRMHGPFI